MVGGVWCSSESVPNRREWRLPILILGDCDPRLTQGNLHRRFDLLAWFLNRVDELLQRLERPGFSSDEVDQPESRRAVIPFGR